MVGSGENDFIKSLCVGPWHNLPIVIFLARPEAPNSRKHRAPSLTPQRERIQSG